MKSYLNGKIATKAQFIKQLKDQIKISIPEIIVD
jgi:hypothetical protein